MPNSRPRSIRSLTGSIILLCGVFAALFTALLGYGLVQSRQLYADQAMATMEGLAATYKAYTEKAVNEVDYSLLLVQEYVRQQGQVGPSMMKAVGTALELRRRHTPYVSNLMISDRQGRVVSVTAGGAPALGQQMAQDREFFTAHQAARDVGFHVGPVIHSRVYPDQLRFTLSRRLEDKHGSFLGVVVAFVDAATLAKDYARQLDDPSVSVTLMRIDGMVMTRTPYVKDQIGKVLPSFERYKGNPPFRSSFTIRSQIDQRSRLIAQRRFDSMPLLIAVTQLEESALQRWQPIVFLALAVWCMAMLGTLGLGALVIHQQRWRERFQREIEDTFAAFNEAQHMAQVGSLDHDLSSGRMHWSDELFRLLEIDPKQPDQSLAACHERVHPDDRARVEHACGQLRALQVPYEVSYRLNLPGGRIKWIMERCSLRFDRMHQPTRIVHTFQDITLRKEAEEALIRGMGGGRIRSGES